MKKTTCTIKTEVWLYPGDTPWHFMSLPKKLSGEIREAHGRVKRGFGSIPVTIKIGKTTWDTSVFPYTKEECYIFPLKASVRAKEGMRAGDRVSATLMFKE